MGAAAGIGGHQGAGDTSAPDVDDLVGADRHLADSAESLGIECHADGVGPDLAAAERNSLRRVVGGAADCFCGIAVVADAEERAVLMVVVVFERAAVPIGIAAEIA